MFQLKYATFRKIQSQKEERRYIKKNTNHHPICHINMYEARFQYINLTKKLIATGA